MGNRQDNRVRSPAPDRDHRPHDVRPCADRVRPSGAVGDRGDDRGNSVGGRLFSDSLHNTKIYFICDTYTYSGLLLYRECIDL